MSMRGSGGGGLVRDGATQTGRAVILIVVAIVVAVVLLHHNKPAALTSSTTTRSASTTLPSSGTTVAPTGTTAPTVPATTTPSTVPVADVKVLVLNGASFAQPYASQFTTKVKNAGYNTLAPNNAASTVHQSAIYVITRGMDAEGKALAATLGLPASAVKTNVPTGPPLSSATPGTGANLVLVVGPDLVSSASSGSASSTTSSPATT